MTSFQRKGSITLLVIIFGGIFFMLLTALSSFVLVENRAEDVAREQAEASSIAEAGLEYYRWFLSHYPGNTTNGTGHAGPYVVNYQDPEGGTAGTYSLSVSGNQACGQVQSVDVTAVGKPTDAPTVTRTLWARYAEPSVSQYAFILNSSAWFTSTINGELHSNGGIRMDGTPTSLVTSSLSTWDCTSSYGCSPEQPNAPGVVGTGGNQSLWEYPTPQTDFAGIAANFSALKSTAQSSGIYLARYSSGSSGSSAYHKGYHLIFNADGTVTVKRVTAITNGLTSVPVDGSSSILTSDYSLINNETSYNTYTLPANCGLIFVEDNTWVEGTIPAKVTLVVANVTNTGVVPEAFIPNNITYSTYDGTVGLTLIAQHDVLIGPNSPDSLTLDGTFIAQSGAFGRNMYVCPDSPYANKTNLTIYGSVISNLKPGTYWTYSGLSMGCVLYLFGTQTSGYANRTTSFDKLNATNPPAFTPNTSTEYEFVDWREE